jgi:hypothetical protein
MIRRYIIWRNKHAADERLRVVGRHLGPNPPGSPGGCRWCWEGRLEHGECGLHLVTGPPARSGGTRQSARIPKRRVIPRQHRPDEALGRSRAA